MAQWNAGDDRFSFEGLKTESVWRLEQTLGTTKDDAAHTPFEYAPCYPVRVPGLNDGSLLSELEMYDELMRMEQETNVLETRLNKLVDDLDDFG